MDPASDSSNSLLAVDRRAWYIRLNLQHVWLGRIMHFERAFLPRWAAASVFTSEMSLWWATACQTQYRGDTAFFSKRI